MACLGVEGRGKGQSKDLREDPRPTVFCALVSLPTLARSGHAGDTQRETRPLAYKNTPSHTTKIHRHWLSSLSMTLFSGTDNRYIFIENTQHTPRDTSTYKKRPMRRHKYLVYRYKAVKQVYLERKIQMTETPA